MSTEVSDTGREVNTRSYTDVLSARLELMS